MSRRTVAVYDCDVCGEEGERYTIFYPDGNLALDLCDKHNVELIALKEKGQWSSSTGRSTFKISTPEEIEKQRKKK